MRQVPGIRGGSSLGEWASLAAQLVKNLQEILVRFLGLKDPLEKG